MDLGRTPICDTPAVVARLRDAATVAGASSLLTRPLAEIFGTGAPGWFARDVPPGTSFDFERGIVVTTFGRFVRSPTSRKWAAAQ